MNRQEAVLKKGKVIGILHIADWGVTFEPAKQNPLFNRIKLKTWESIESARAEVLRVVNQMGSVK